VIEFRNKSSEYVEILVIKNDIEVPEFQIQPGDRKDASALAQQNWILKRRDQSLPKATAFNKGGYCTCPSGKIFAASCNDSGCMQLACDGGAAVDLAYTSSKYNSVEGEWSYRQVNCRAGIIGGYRLEVTLSANYIVRLSVDENFQVFEEFFERDKFFGEVQIVRYYTSILTGAPLEAALSAGPFVNDEEDEPLEFKIRFVNESHETLSYHYMNKFQIKELGFRLLGHEEFTRPTLMGQIWLIDDSEGTTIAVYTPEANLSAIETPQITTDADLVTTGGLESFTNVCIHSHEQNQVFE
jgi:hypothetical protein